MRKLLLSLIVGIALLAIGSFTLVSAQDGSDSTSDTAEAPPERDSVALTIYNQGTALVQDRRTYTFTVGNNIINFTDVASQIDPTSVNFVSLTDPLGTSVLEQNYIYDLVGTSALLRRYVDETIRVTLPSYTMPEVPKHSAGYFVRPAMDLIDLIIGAEGTLGIVTSVKLSLAVPRPDWFVALLPMAGEAAA